MKKVKTRTLKDYNGNKFKSIVVERRSLKDLIEYEISETYERDKETDKIYDKMVEVEKKLYQTITVEEKELIDELFELHGDADYAYHQYFYETLWKMLEDWDA